MASRKRGRLGWIVLILVLVLAALAGGYAWAWFHYAGELRTAATESLATLGSEGRQAECPDMATSGFPLSLQLSCSGFIYRDPTRGVAVETGPVRSAAKVYDPLGISATFEEPATVALEGMPALRLTWASLTADTRLARPLPEHVAIAGSDIAAALADGGERLLHVGTAHLQARPEGADLDLALAFEKLAVGQSLTPGIDLPPLDGAARITVDDGIALLARPPKSLRGLSANVQNASVSSGEAKVTVSGPVAVDANGLVNAQLSVTVHQPQQIAALLGDVRPQMREQIDTAFSTLAMLGESPTLPLTITNGEASIGFINIGRLPPLR
jgi:hypothetical protein